MSVIIYPIFLWDENFLFVFINVFFIISDEWVISVILYIPYAFTGFVLFWKVLITFEDLKWLVGFCTLEFPKGGKLSLEVIPLNPFFFGEPIVFSLALGLKKILEEGSVELFLLS